MIALVALSAIGAAPQWEAAFACRIYFEGHRRSYHQIYVGSRNGERMALTTTETPKFLVTWRGRNHVAWLERFSERGSVLKEYDLRSNRTNVVDYSKGAANLLAYDRAKGETLYVLDGVAHLGRASGWSKGGALTLDREVRTLPDSEDVFTLGPSSSVRVRGNDLEFDGKRLTVLPDLSLVSAMYRTPDPMIHYVEIQNGFGLVGRQLNLYRVDWTSRTHRVVIRNKDEIDFQPGSAMWAGIDGIWTAETLKDGRRFWTTAAYLGNAQTGQTWRITPKLSQTRRVVVRPGL